jgi:hypothetical protein
MSGNWSIWDTLPNFARAWYDLGPMGSAAGPGEPDLRAVIIDPLFDVFDIKDASANCVAPLAAIAQLDSEIRASAGVATEFQKQAVMQKIAGLYQWLNAKSQALNDAFNKLNKCIAQNVQGSRDALAQELAREADPPSPGGSQLPYLELYQRVGKQLIELADACDAPSDTLVIAWATMLSTVNSVVDRIAAASTENLGSILQTLDIQASMTLWPELCSSAITYRPGPRPPLPSTPPGFDLQ